MESIPQNLPKEYVKNQNFTSIAQIMNAMKNMFKNVIEQVMKHKLEKNLGFEKGQHTLELDDSCIPKSYHKDYSKKKRFKRSSPN